MKILVLGGSGQVGFQLAHALSPLGSLIMPKRRDLDLLDSKETDRYLCKINPSIIINAAAWTSVDEAESHVPDARRMNSELPMQLASFAYSKNIRLIHYSTDYVHSGEGNTPWLETSLTSPLSAYGITKRDGDDAIISSGVDYLIFRTSWVYSARGDNFMKTILRLAKCKDELRIVGDQIGAPTPAHLISQITALAIYNGLSSGLYNLSTKGKTSWFEFALKIFELAERAGEKLKIRMSDIKTVDSKDYPAVAARPLNSLLDTSKLEKALNIQLPTWESQLDLILTEYLEGK